MQSDFSGTRVLVVGDVMLDRYWWGSVSRISPEAPVPIVKLKSSTVAAGGAANVAANVAGLGAVPRLVGVIGDDADGEVLCKELSKTGVSPNYLFKVVDRPTTVKTRVIAHSQQVTRVDQETDEDLSDEDTRRLLKNLDDLIGESDVVVVSDYAKGLLTCELLSGLINSCSKSGKKVLVDPKGKDYSKYSGASLLTPNQKEATEACKLDENGQNTVRIAGEQLLFEQDVEAVLVTQGEDGMTLFRRDQAPVHFHALARQVFDVTGAGDTVIATLASAVGAGADLERAARLANIAAGVVVEQVGTTIITAEALHKAIELHRFA